MSKFKWKDVWEKKGAKNTKDLILLNGFESTSADPKKIANEICTSLKTSDTDKILEVGCGAGMLSQHIECDYTGIDYSKTLVEKIKSILNKKAIVSEANNIPFEDNSFDFVFAYSVFHYFENYRYATQVIEEMTRVAKKSILIGDLPFESHDTNHLLYTKRMFSDWEITDGYYTDKRFNVFKNV